VSAAVSTTMDSNIATMDSNTITMDSN
jgi:hypothetical protein